ncbi:hypothetical protein [Marinobacterium jannaschii]|uniref:hypothetical protein n=1 Tax=Marinobacterium jannaschii TaxID=64970 RepID=UPI00047F1D26|nr:hypothetical protein [Marinobacterium jannaschii]
MKKKPYQVVAQHRVGQRWLEPGGDPVWLADAEAGYPLSRGWLKQLEEAGQDVTEEQEAGDAAE